MALDLHYSPTVRQETHIIITDIGVGIRSTNQNSGEEWAELAKFVVASLLIVPISCGQRIVIRGVVAA
jgi:hypothetical protein